MIWTLIKGTFAAFIADGALSQGAAIAYYTIFSLAPVLIIVIAIAGLAFGQDAAQGAIVQQLGGMMGTQSAEALQAMIKSANNQKSGIIATVIGLGTLVITASGVFSQMQTALNQIWKAQAPASTVSRLVRARIASLGLVATLGFLLMVSLVISAVTSALDRYLNGLLPGAHILLTVLNFVVSLGLIAVLFGAIYKVLPDKPIAWRDVTVGAIVTAFLFTIGKTLIGLYLGHSHVASSYGGAGAFVIILLWIYYSSQIFLLGAEFTRVYAENHGSHSQGGENAAANPAYQPVAQTSSEPPTGSSSAPEKGRLLAHRAVPAGSGLIVARKTEPAARKKQYPISTDAPAFMLGMTAGLRTTAAPAAISWAARLGAFETRPSWARFMGWRGVSGLFIVFAVVEAMVDLFPGLPSRTTSPQFAARLASGAFCGAVIGKARGGSEGGGWRRSVIAGAAGAATGALGGAALRGRLADTVGKDWPVALAEDAVAMVGALAAVLCSQWRGDGGRGARLSLDGSSKITQPIVLSS